MNNNNDLLQTIPGTASLPVAALIVLGLLLFLGGCPRQGDPPGQKAESNGDGAQSVIVNSATVTAIHALDDRVRLLECQLFNARTRAVTGEPSITGSDANSALDFDEESIDHDEESIDHDEESIDHDEETIDHDEEAIDHDEETIDHDEESIDHDEVFRKLVACRRDTLELQKKYLQCVTARARCVADGGSYPQCNAGFRECAAATRKSE